MRVKTFVNSKQCVQIDYKPENPQLTVEFQYFKTRSMYLHVLVWKLFI